MTTFPSNEQQRFKDQRHAAREKVWQLLDEVALPDSRFDRDFSSFIPDFTGSSTAVEHLCQSKEYRDAKLLFITPDNCTEELRLRALQDGKMFLTTSYGIRRGFWLLEHTRIDQENFRVAAMLDGMERYGRPMTLCAIRDAKLKIELAVTGTGGIDRYGVRFGKGHGYFDLEWGILYSIGAVSTRTRVGERPTEMQNSPEVRVFGIAHECQIVDEVFPRAFCDTRCAAVATPTGLKHFEPASTKQGTDNPDDQPECGIVWARLPAGLIAGIPPLAELRDITGLGTMKV